VKRVTIDYTNWRGERSIRDIMPLGMAFSRNQWHPEPQWLVYAYDIEKKETRAFAMLKIHSWVKSEKEGGNG
jgi:predicted DNA-binding transcriptional regulator YafY